MKVVSNRHFGKYALSVILAGVLLYFSFRGVNWGDFISGLRDCNWWFVLLSMLAGVAAFYFRGLRWRTILVPFDASISRKTAFNAVNIGYIANFVFPRIGEFVRCGVIARNSRRGGNGGADYEKVLGTVVLERVWDLISMCVLIVGLLVFSWKKFGGFFRDEIFMKMNISVWWLLLLLLLSAAVSLFVVWRFRNSGRLAGKIWKIVSGLMQGFSSCMMMDRKWRFIALTVLIWLMYWLMAASIMWAVPNLTGFTLSDALFLSLVGGLGWIVPVPGGFGAFHYIVSLALLVVYGIPMEVGVVFATLSHESQAVTMAIFGGISYVSESLAESKRG